MKIRLSEIREDRGFNQAFVAESVGVSPKTEWNWEKGETFPNACQLFQLCELLGTDPNTLLGWYEEHPEDAPHGAMSNEESALLDNYRACTDERRRVVINAARDQCALSRDMWDVSGSSNAHAV